MYRAHRIPHLVVTVSVVFLVLASCGGSDPGAGPGTGPDPGVVTVTVSPNVFTVLVGGSQQLTARDQAGRTLIGSAVTWATSATAVATVSPSGLVTGAADGPATITATAEGKSGTAAVTVVSPLSVAFTSVTTGGAHTCGLSASGAAYCWGRGEAGQIGVASPASVCPIGGRNYPCSLVPVAVQGGLTFTRLDAGGSHVCGLTSAGTAYCWGSNSAGQLGDNSLVDRSAPVPVAGGLTFASVAAGVFHTCGVTAAGTAHCWGANDRGQLGDGTNTPRSVPTAVSGGHSFVMITAGGFFSGHTCGVTGSGTAYCWGDSSDGQLGIGTANAAAHPVPAPISGIAFASISAGLGSHTCALTPAGSAYCWGQNAFGALGDGSGAQRQAPVAVTGGIVFAQIVAGGFIGHTCGRTSTGQGYCWGENEVGAVGDGSLADRFAPTAIAGQHSFSSLDAGFRHTCGLVGTALYCWGSNGAGQLGVNSVAAQMAPTRVAGSQ